MQNAATKRVDFDRHLQQVERIFTRRPIRTAEAKKQDQAQRRPSVTMAPRFERHSHYDSVEKRTRVQSLYTLYTAVNIRALNIEAIHAHTYSGENRRRRRGFPGAVEVVARVIRTRLYTWAYTQCTGILVRPMFIRVAMNQSVVDTCEFPIRIYIYYITHNENGLCVQLLRGTVTGSPEIMTPGRITFFLFFNRRL